MLERTKKISLYEQCEQFIVTSIEEGKFNPGEYLPPERDLSTRLGVNRLTLRKALANLINKGIIESIPGAGNRVVSRLNKSERKRAVACIMLQCETAPTLSPYFAEVFEGLHNEVARREYVLNYMPIASEKMWDVDGNERDVSRLVRDDVAGVIVIGGVSNTLVEAYEYAGIPIVLFDKPSKIVDVPSVIPDNKSGGVAAAEHLIGLGHKKIGFIEGGFDPVSDARKDGVLSVLQREGLSVDPRWIITGGYSIDSAQDAVNSFIALYGTEKLPTAFVVVNDEAAFGVMKALTQNGICVPDDISLVGFDDIPWAKHFSPPLTTLAIPRIKMGEWAMRLLIDRIEEADLSSVDVQLPTKLIIRESTCPPKKTGKLE